MSGRLIILRHKKWNVWNRENIEKVKKDERLHREEVEANAKRSRDINAERLMETLKGGAVDIPSEAEGAVSSTAVVTYKVNRQAENEEYRREREEKELLQKRLEGSAPFALGEGSAEMKKIKPWYMEKNTIGGNESAVIGGKRLQGEAAVAALDRDMARKLAEDPMAGFIQTATPGADNPSRDHTTSSGEYDDRQRKRSRNGEFPGFDHLSGFMGASDDTGLVNDTSTQDRHQHKRSKKKDKKKRKKKSRKQDDSSASERDSSESECRRGNRRSGSRKKHRGDRRSSDDSDRHLSSEDILRLRQKRAEREKNERLRESLLATKQHN